MDRKEQTKDKLIQAVGRVLAREGFKGIGVNKVARAAGVDKVLVYRYFGGLPDLLAAFSESVDFWPTMDELVADTPGNTGRSPDEQVADFFKAFARALRRRPQTIEILAWEMLERNELTRQLEQRRIRTALEYFERLDQLPDDDTLSAVMVLMGGAVNHLLVKSRIHGSVGGIDLSGDQGWQRIEAGMDRLLRGIFNR